MGSRHAPRGERLARVAVLAVGTRGDVQPLLALAISLRDSDVDTALVTHAAHKTWVQQPAEAAGVRLCWLSSPPARGWEDAAAGQAASSKRKQPGRDAPGGSAVVGGAAGSRADSISWDQQEQQREEIIAACEATLGRCLPARDCHGSSSAAGGPGGGGAFGNSGGGGGSAGGGRSAGGAHPSSSHPPSTVPAPQPLPGTAAQPHPEHSIPHPCPAQPGTTSHGQTDNSPGPCPALLIFNLFALEGFHLAEALGLPCLAASPCLVPYGPPPWFDRRFEQVHPELYQRLRAADEAEEEGRERSRPGARRRSVGWREVRHWLWPLFSERWGAWRYHRLGLPAVPYSACPSGYPLPPPPLLLYGVSECVVARPGFWPDSVHLCGYWHSPRCFTATQRQLPPSLLRVLGAQQEGGGAAPGGRGSAGGQQGAAASAGGQQGATSAGGQRGAATAAAGTAWGAAAAPICVDFGSMGQLGLLPRPQLLAAVLHAAARRLQRRVVLLTAGWRPLLDACGQLVARTQLEEQQQQHQYRRRQQQRHQEQPGEEQPAGDEGQASELQGGPLQEQPPDLQSPAQQAQQDGQQASQQAPAQQDGQQSGQQAAVEQPGQQAAERQLRQPCLLALEQPVPHDELLPRCAALLHHGGAGTVAAALRCGTPQLVCPLLFDQQQWAERVEWMGCGVQLGPVALVQQQGGQRGEWEEGKEEIGSDRGAGSEDGRQRRQAVGQQQGQQEQQQLASEDQQVAAEQQRQFATEQQQEQQVEQAAEAVAAAFTALLEDEQVGQQCASLRQQLAGEDGLAAAVRLVKQVLKEAAAAATAAAAAAATAAAVAVPQRGERGVQQGQDGASPAAANAAPGAAAAAPPLPPLPLAPAQRVRLPGGLEVQCLSPGEALFIHKEVFQDDCYLPAGIALGPGSVVVDAGANIGFFALRLLLDPSLSPRVDRLYAFEPLPPTAELLEANLRQHGASDKVVVLRCGLHSSPGALPFTFYPLMPGNSTARPAEKWEHQRPAMAAMMGGEAADRCFQGAARVDCPVTTLAQFSREQQLHRIDLLKIDVEGSELEVMRGLDAPTWRLVRQVVGEVHDVDGRLEAAVWLLEGAGFAVHTERPQAGPLNNWLLYAWNLQQAASSSGADDQ